MRLCSTRFGGECPLLALGPIDTVFESLQPLNFIGDFDQHIHCHISINLDNICISHSPNLRFFEHTNFSFLPKFIIAASESKQSIEAIMNIAAATTAAAAVTNNTVVVIVVVDAFPPFLSSR